MTPEPMPKNVAACRAADLSADHAGAQGAGGWWTGGLRLVSKGPRCLLYGYVQLRFRDSAGREMAQGVPSAPGAQRDWAVLGEAQVAWTWGNWCTPNVAVASIVATLPSDPTPIVARVDPPMLVGARCYDASTATSVSTGPVRPWPTPLPMLTAPPASLAARIDLPAVAIAGQKLRYVLTLTNLTTEIVTLDPCPSYLEWLGGHPLPTPSPPQDWPSSKPWAPIRLYGGLAKEAHLLNCDGVSAIEPRASIAFEMRIALPADAIGADTLRWSFAMSSTPTASAPITIVRR